MLFNNIEPGSNVAFECMTSSLYNVHCTLTSHCLRLMNGLDIDGLMACKLDDVISLPVP